MEPMMHIAVAVWAWAIIHTGLYIHVARLRKINASEEERIWNDGFNNGIWEGFKAALSIPQDKKTMLKILEKDKIKKPEFKA